MNIHSRQLTKSPLKQQEFATLEQRPTPSFLSPSSAWWTFHSKYSQEERAPFSLISQGTQCLSRRYKPPELLISSGSRLHGLNSWVVGPSDQDALSPPCPHSQGRGFIAGRAGHFTHKLEVPSHKGHAPITTQSSVWKAKVLFLHPAL